MFRRSAFVFGGNIVATAFLFARNVFLARLLPIEDYGIAMTFVILVSAMELATNIAADRLLIQAKDGDDPALENTMHAFEILRGAALAVILFFLAGPLADFFRVPEAIDAFRMLALVPLIRGFRHLDMFRVQRAKNFGPFVKTPLIGQGIATLAVFPLVMLLPDYRTMLASILIQHLLFVVMSHYYAVRPYRIAWSRDFIRRILVFGWPLMANGLLMFLILNGDRMIVGNQFGPATLGWFSAAFLLSLSPSMIIGKTLQTLFLPTLSRRHQQERDFALGAQAAVQAGVIAGLGLAVILATIGPFVFLLLFGPRFEPAMSFLVLLGLMQGIRISKAGPSSISLASGHTTDPLTANLVRICALPVAVAVVVAGGTVTQLVAISILGEVAALLVALFLVNKRTGLTWRAWVPILLLIGAVGALTVHISIGVEAAAAAILNPDRLALLLVFLSAYFVARELRKMMRRLGVREPAADG